MLAAFIAEVAYLRFFPVIKELKYNPQKEKYAHCHYQHDKNMFCHKVHPPGMDFASLVPGPVRSAMAESMVLN